MPHPAVPAGPWAALKLQEWGLPLQKVGRVPVAAGLPSISPNVTPVCAWGRFSSVLAPKHSPALYGGERSAPVCSGVGSSGGWHLLAVSPPLPSASELNPVERDSVCPSIRLSFRAGGGYPCPCI